MLSGGMQMTIVGVDRRAVPLLNSLAGCVLCVWYTVPALTAFQAVFFVAAALWACTVADILHYLKERAGAFLPLCVYLAFACAYALARPEDANFAGAFRATLLGLFCLVWMDYTVFVRGFRQLRCFCAVSLLSLLG